MTEPARPAPRIYPFLRYDDAPGAIEWLGQAFGFERHFVVPGDGDTVAHAQLTLGSGMIMLGSGGGDPFGMKSPRALGGVSQGIYVYVEEVDAHHRRARAAGAEIVYEPRDTEYGSREYAARDPEGYVWSFGTYRPSASDPIS